MSTSDILNNCCEGYFVIAIASCRRRWMGIRFGERRPRCALGCFRGVAVQHKRRCDKVSEKQKTRRARVARRAKKNLALGRKYVKVVIVMTIF